MKLQKLTIKNFRWLKWNDNIIDFSESDIIFLIWQNNVWKSSFLRAYEFFVNSSQKAINTDFYNYDSKIPIEIEWEFLKEDDDNDDIDLLWDKTNKDPDWINKWVDNNNIVKVKKIWREEDNGFDKETFNPKEQKWVKDGFWWLHQKFTKYTPTPISINAMESEYTLEEKVNKLIQDDFLKKAETNHKSSYEKAIEAIKELQNDVLSVKELAEYNLSINKSFCNVFVWYSLEIKPKWDKLKIEWILNKDHSINVQKTWVIRDENFSQNWHWIIRQALFNFLTFLKKTEWTNKKDYLILFEEPELFLHPKIAYKLRKSLYDLVKDSPYQILCASHSPLMIDISKPHSSIVRIAKDQSEETKSYQVWDDVFQKDEETKDFVQMINKFNPHICEVFYADKVILVEWDTETIFYRKMLEEYYPDEEIFVLNTGSKNNMPFFQKILTHFSIKQYVIHDLDTEFVIDKNWIIEKNKDWTDKKNSAWKLNKNIWDYIKNSNWLTKWYICKNNFEEENNYKYDSTKWKPLSAYDFAVDFCKNKKSSEIPFLNNIVKDLKWEFEFNEKLIKLNNTNNFGNLWI